MTKRALVAVLTAGLSCCGMCSAQSAMATFNVLTRTFMIQNGQSRATAFSISVDNREYWITAKHVFTGIKRGPAGEFKMKRLVANILSQDGGESGNDQRWLTEQFTVMDPGKDIYILVLVPARVLGNTDRSMVLQAQPYGPMLGGDCEFLGFPWLGGWKTHIGQSKHWVWLPYVKRCEVSGTMSEHKVWVLDGINNEGFSGGPVVYNTGPNQRVFAVISGFYQEPLEVVSLPASGQKPTSHVPQPPKLPEKPKKNPDKQIVEANSGFIVAFGIEPALDAIRANPIGPLIPEPTEGTGQK